MPTMPEPAGSLEVALRNAAQFLTTEPRLAREQAAEILKVVPGHPVATLLLGVAHARLGDTDAAAAVLRPLADTHPDGRRPTTSWAWCLVQPGTGRRRCAHCAGQ